MSAPDYRAAGYLGADRKKLVDDDVAHFARMGWDGLRLATWGDRENADSAGNLIANEHLDLLDYVVAQARARGIFMLRTTPRRSSSRTASRRGATTSPPPAPAACGFAFARSARCARRCT